MIERWASFASCFDCPSAASRIFLGSYTRTPLDRLEVWCCYMRRILWELPLVFIAALLCSCDSMPDSDEMAEADGGLNQGGGAPGFAAVYDEVFHNKENALLCTACHDFIGAGLSKQQLYERLVNTTAQREPCKGEVRVVPGDLQASLLWKKLAPDLEVCGSKMPRSIPLFGPAPTAAQLDLLKAWIEGGAKP